MLALTVLQALTRASKVISDERVSTTMATLTHALAHRSLAEACGMPTRIGDTRMDAVAESASLEVLSRVLSVDSPDVRAAALEGRTVHVVASWLEERFFSTSDESFKAGLCCLSLGCTALESALQAETTSSAESSTEGSVQQRAAQAISEAFHVVASVCALDVSAHARNTGLDGRPEETTTSSDSSKQARPRVVELLQRQCSALEAATLFIESRSARHAAVQKALDERGSASTQQKWNENLSIAVLRVLKSKHAPVQVVQAAVCVLSALTSAFGPTALLLLPRKPTAVSLVDGEGATEMAVVLAQKINVEVFGYLQGISLKVKAAYSESAYVVFDCCVELLTRLLDLLMTDSMEDFGDVAHTRAVDACSRAGEALLVAAVLSDDVATRVCSNC